MECDACGVYGAVCVFTDLEDCDCGECEYLCEDCIEEAEDG